MEKGLYLGKGKRGLLFEEGKFCFQRMKKEQTKKVVNVSVIVSPSKNNFSLKKGMKSLNGVVWFVDIYQTNSFKGE